jgi:radical SAM protein with 4Fe4S-binding SPASM domain
MNAAPARFTKVYVEIGNVCNLQCSFCPEVERGKDRMDEAQLRRVLREVKPYAERVTYHLMGEPLAHPEFTRFVDVAGEEGVPLEITTNGTLLKPASEAALLHPTVAQVNFSLQSFFDNFPNADPETYLKRIFTFCHRALAERPELYLNFRLWNLPRGSAEDALNERLLLRIESEFGAEVNRRLDLRMKKGKRLRGRLYLHYDSRFRWPSLADPELRQEGSCWGGRKQMAVHANGAVVPCCLDKEAKIGLGNLHEEGFAEILASPRAASLREGFEKGELREDLCRRCDYAMRFKARNLE